MKNTIYNIIVLLLCLLLVACGGKKDKEAQLSAYKKELKELQSKISKLEKEVGVKKEEKPYPVGISLVEKSDFESFIEVPGTITSKQNVQLFAEMPGNITQVYVCEGQYINKGSIIARQDASTISTQIGQLKANLSLANTTFERQKRLWEQKIGSEIQYLQAKTNVEALEAQVQALNAQVAKFTIYSPISGVVDEVFVNQGEAPIGSIARIINLKNIQMEAQLSEEYIGKVKNGDKVTVLAPNLNIERITKISSVGQVINPDSRTFRIEASLTNCDRKLKPNMTANMKIMIAQIKDGVIIPANIIQKDGDRDFVYLADSTGIALQQYIEIYAMYQGVASVKDGLSGGEQLIVEGHTEVSDSARIEIINMPAIVED